MKEHSSRSRRWRRPGDPATLEGRRGQGRARKGRDDRGGRCGAQGARQGAFTVSIDLAISSTARIAPTDRATSSRALAGPAPVPVNLTEPGSVLRLTARSGGARPAGGPRWSSDRPDPPGWAGANCGQL
ncbi:3,4-dihydroxy-2-butanone-4-phosphate synthase [Pseudonocardia kujensis]|uniref:3,4-dihydroxy-2-butanone-4-phosphate synthase n=1 Tax=Pseudonocardia kujensis TaxID=1128675 RepID=UPI003556457E